VESYSISEIFHLFQFLYFDLFNSHLNQFDQTMLSPLNVAIRNFPMLVASEGSRIDVAAVEFY